MPIPNQESKIKGSSGANSSSGPSCCGWCFDKPKNKKKKNNNGEINLDEIQLKDCFKMISDVDQLKGEDQLFCEICDSMQDATKQMKLWKTPDILIATL